MQSDALVEAMARAICAQSRPNADPDAWTAPERGSMQQRRIWHLFEPMALAALAALRQHRPDVAAVLGGEAVAVPREAIEAWRKRDAHHPLVAAASPYAPPGDAP